MANWQLLIGDSTYSLVDRSPFDLVSISGVGAPPVRRITQRGPYQHGVTDLGFRLEPRVLNLVLALSGASRSVVEAARDTLSQALGPRTSTMVKLRHTREDGTIRELAGHLSGMMEADVDLDRWGPVFQRVGVQFMAPDPVWYDPESKQVTSALASVSAGLAIPFATPMVVASDTGSDGTVQVPYTGTFDEFPVVVLTGPITDALIQNQTTGDELNFSGYTITAGTVVTVDLRYGHKSVTTDAGTNLVDKLTSDSDLATFRLLSTLETSDGLNIVRLSGSGLTAASQVSLIYYERFLNA